MRVSYNWLKQYLDLEMPAEELAKRYTLAGLEYDEVVTVGEEFSGVVVAKVLSCDKVEKAITCISARWISALLNHSISFAVLLMSAKGSW